MPSADSNINNAPTYLKSLVAPISPKGPSQLILDGSWCAHGEESFRVYDIAENSNSVFQIQLPDRESEELIPPAVNVISSATGKVSCVYDSRKHPASMYSMDEYGKTETKFLDNYRCEKCNQPYFKISIGLEIPEDSQGPDDITFFVLATECVTCNDRAIVFEDETA